MSHHNNSPPQSTHTLKLKSKIETLLCHLPAIEEIQLRAEPDYYGASFEITKQVELKFIPPSHANWSHGWKYYPLINPILLLAGMPKQQNLVATTKQADFLQTHGHKACAVGVPFIYAHQPAIHRIPNSLLIMPQHATTHVVVNDMQSPQFTHEILELKNKFDTTVACISGMCVKHHSWIEYFENVGIPWITGAWVYDRNALLRMKTIFSLFEYVATNSFGSHIAYAAYCGCKIFTFSEIYKHDYKKSLIDEPFYKKHPELIPIVMKYNSESYLRNKYPFFFGGVEGAQDMTSWAKSELGENNRKDAAEVARLLGWEIDTHKSKIIQSPVDLADSFSARALSDAVSALQQNDHQGALEHLNRIKSKKVRVKGVDYTRAQVFLAKNEVYAACEAMKEELRYFPDNIEAQKLYHKIEKSLFTASEIHSEIDHLIAAIRPYTMVGEKRLSNLYQLAKTVCMEDIPGNFVECGVAAGGSSALLAAVIRQYSKRPRLLFCFDTFEGMPEPGEEDLHQNTPAATGWGAGTCAAAEQSLLDICSKLDVRNIVVPIKGLFKDTLPKYKAKIGPIAFLHMDGDWYASTRDILENLYDQIVPQGCVQVDDYGHWEGCKKALHEFESEKNVSFTLHPIDGTGVWFQKPALPTSTQQNPSINSRFNTRGNISNLNESQPVFQGSLGQAFSKLKSVIATFPRRKAGKLIIDGKSLFFADLHSFYHELVQIFSHHLYEFKTETADPVIIDCGAHVGLASIFFASRYPNAVIYGFEADPMIFDIYAHNIHSLGFSNVIQYSRAIWVHDRGVSFATSGDDSGHIDERGALTIPTVRLRDFLADLDTIDLLKLDVEGAEFSILKDCADALKRVRNIIIEVHKFGDPNSSLATLLGIIEQSGFHYTISDLHEASWLTSNEVSPFTFSAHDKFLFTIFAWKNSLFKHHTFASSPHPPFNGISQITTPKNATDKPDHLII